MFEVSGDVEELRQLGRALRKEADGKELRRDLIRNLKRPLAPAVAEIKAGLMSMGSGGLLRGQESLRRAVARRITTQVKLSGFRAGVNVRARKTPAVRDFANAAKRINSSKGWRHRLFGGDTWVTQRGKPGYFDDPLLQRRDEFRREVQAAMQEVADRLATRSEGG